MELTENVLKILNARYLLKYEKGNVIETPEYMFRRVAHNIANVEELYDKEVDYWEESFFDLMASLKFLPNSPALMNAGKSGGAACFVFCPPPGRLHEEHIRHIKECSVDTSERWRNGLFIFQIETKVRYRKVNGRNCQRPRVFYEDL